MSDVTTQQATASSTELTTISTLGLATVDKKGNRVSFERSIAFASKDARMQLSATVYARQLDNGVYGPLVRDALAAGVLGKQATEIVHTMLAAQGRNPSKSAIVPVLAVMLSAWATKEPKGQKAFYVGMIKTLAKSLSEQAAPVQQ